MIAPKYLLLRLLHRRADDGALEVNAVRIVERAATGDEGQVFFVGRANDVLDRGVRVVEVADPVDKVGIGLAVVAGDVDRIALGESGDVVKDRGADIPV